MFLREFKIFSACRNQIMLSSSVLWRGQETNNLHYSQFLQYLPNNVCSFGLSLKMVLFEVFGCFSVFVDLEVSSKIFPARHNQIMLSSCVFGRGCRNNLRLAIFAKQCLVVGWSLNMVHFEIFGCCSSLFCCFGSWFKTIFCLS